MYVYYKNILAICQCHIFSVRKIQRLFSDRRKHDTPGLPFHPPPADHMVYFYCNSNREDSDLFKSLSPPFKTIILVQLPHLTLVLFFAEQAQNQRQKSIYFQTDRRFWFRDRRWREARFRHCSLSYNTVFPFHH